MEKLARSQVHSRREALSGGAGRKQQLRLFLNGGEDAIVFADDLRSVRVEGEMQLVDGILAVVEEDLVACEFPMAGFPAFPIGECAVLLECADGGPAVLIPTEAPFAKKPLEQFRCGPGLFGGDG